MYTIPHDECSLEQLAADERADAYRAELADFEEAYNRSLFLSEATAAARREPTEAELEAEHRRQMLSQHASDLLRCVNRYIPHDRAEWQTAMHAVIRLASELNVTPLAPPAA